MQKFGGDGLPSYEELLSHLATECDGMSGASLAGVARAAASHALERVVEEYSTTVAQKGDASTTMMDCLVTKDDFELAIHDVNESAGDRDWEPSDDEREETSQTEDSKNDDDNGDSDRSPT